MTELELRRVVVGPLATNCWILHPTGSGAAVIIDPGDDPDRILAACADLDVTAVVLTHTHWDHVLALPELLDELRVPVLAGPGEDAVWRHELAHLDEHGTWDAGTSGLQVTAVPGRRLWDGACTPTTEGARLEVGGSVATIAHTPGHTPGGLTVAIEEHLFTGDTLFPGGPGLTGWPLSDFATIMVSVERLLGEHPAATTIHPGHGADTTVGAERPHLSHWRARGW